MKIKNKIIILSVLLIGSMMITPALASTTPAEYQTRSLTKNPETITLEFIDCTGVIPLKKEITLSKTEWKSITEELKTITSSETTMNGKFTAQLSVFQKHNLVSQDINIDALLIKFNKKTNYEIFRSLQDRLPKRLPINNTIFSALSAISFTMENENGSALVFGLNTFINYIGFDIISLHKGYATGGIQTTGLISKSVPPGEYAGFIFGFFGYWFGEKISTGVYSDLTVSGLAIITAWVPVP
jgi:hypothetical protein